MNTENKKKENIKCFDCIWSEPSMDEKYIACLRPVFRKGFLVEDYLKNWCDNELFQKKE